MARVLHELRVVIDSAEEFVEEAASRVSDALGAFGNRHVVQSIAPPASERTGDESEAATGASEAAAEPAPAAPQPEPANG